MRRRIPVCACCSVRCSRSSVALAAPPGAPAAAVLGPGSAALAFSRLLSREATADSPRLLAGLLLCVVLNAAVAELADLTVQNMPAQLPLLEDLHVLGLVRSVPRRCCLECLRLKCLLERTVCVHDATGMSVLVLDGLVTSRAARFGWAPRAWHPSA